jgi:hypothetical protein
VQIRDSANKVSKSSQIKFTKNLDQVAAQRGELADRGYLLETLWRPLSYLGVNADDDLDATLANGIEAWQPRCATVRLVGACWVFDPTVVRVVRF